MMQPPPPKIQPHHYLPAELWLSILLYLQPDYFSLVDDPWTRASTCIPVPSSSRDSSAHDPRVTTSRTRAGGEVPTLLALSWTSTWGRRVSLLHPFWRAVAWHHLVPRRDWGAGGLERFFNVVMDGSAFGRGFAVDLWLDVTSGGGGGNLGLSAACVRRVMMEGMAPAVSGRVVVMELGGRVAATEKVLEVLAGWMKRGEVERLAWGGARSPGVLRMLGDGDLGRWVRPKGGVVGGPGLTRLCLDGYGVNSFSWTSLRNLLTSVGGGLTHLALAHVRGGVDLWELAALNPVLESLCISFQDEAVAFINDGAGDTESVAEHDEGFESVAPDCQDSRTPKPLRRTHPPPVPFLASLVPKLRGDLSRLRSLTSLTLQPHPTSVPGHPMNNHGTLHPNGSRWNGGWMPGPRAVRRRCPCERGCEVPAPLITHLIASLGEESRTKLRRLRCQVRDGAGWVLAELAAAIGRLKGLEVMEWCDGVKLGNKKGRGRAIFDGDGVESDRVEAVANALLASVGDFNAGGGDDCRPKQIFVEEDVYSFFAERMLYDVTARHFLHRFHVALIR
ncbi:hypothetical protein HK101_007250 [Irineochytrium annulatum]|nr:hypothetical protein HK101_007250 [Irineochytrium annulatum]